MEIWTHSAPCAGAVPSHVVLAPPPPSSPPPPPPSCPRLPRGSISACTKVITLGVSGLLIIGIASSQTDSSPASPVAETTTTTQTVSDSAEEAPTTTQRQATTTTQTSSPSTTSNTSSAAKSTQQTCPPSWPSWWWPTRPPTGRHTTAVNTNREGGAISTATVSAPRHDVLAERSLVPVTWTSSGCSVATGEWIDRYTGETLSTVEAATIDHHVALAEAHRSGGWQWDLDTKFRFTNDPGAGQLTIVGSAINQSKADSRPDRWLPPNPADHCDYVARWVEVKHRWRLSVTESEHAAIEATIGTCDSVTSPAALVGTAPPLIVTSTTAPATTTTIQVDEAAPGSVVLVACERRAERVTLANNGGTTKSLSGLHASRRRRQHRVSLGQFGSIQPGDTLTILTGPDAVVADGEVVWKRQHVWNNDGDTAFPIAPDGTQASTRC